MGSPSQSVLMTIVSETIDVIVIDPWDGMTRVFGEDGDPVSGWSVDTMDVDRVEAGFLPSSSFTIKDNHLYGMSTDPKSEGRGGDNVQIENWYVVDGNGDAKPFVEGMPVGESGKIVLDYKSYHVTVPGSAPLVLPKGETFTLPKATVTYSTTYTNQSGTLDFKNLSRGSKGRYEMEMPTIPGYSSGELFNDSPLKYRNSLNGEWMNYRPLWDSSVFGYTIPGVSEIKIEDWVPEGTQLTFIVAGIQNPETGSIVAGTSMRHPEINAFP